MAIKEFTRRIASNSIALAVTPYVVEGFAVSLKVESLVVGAVVLSLVNFFVKPLVKIISFPINVITLGFFGIVINAALLYLVVELVDGISISDGALKLDMLGLGLDAVQISWWMVLVAASIIISIINGVLKKVIF